MKIERTTKTQLITSRKRRFRKSDGLEVGSSGGFGRLRVVIPREGEVATVRAKCRRRKLAYDIDTACTSSKLMKIPLKALELIAEAVEKANAETT